VSVQTIERASSLPHERRRSEATALENCSASAERKRESDRNVKGGYCVSLPVSINVAGLFPDISRSCRAKIYLPLARNGNRSIPHSRARGRMGWDGTRARWNECHVDSVMKKKKQGTRVKGERRPFHKRSFG